MRFPSLITRVAATFSLGIVLLTACAKKEEANPNATLTPVQYAAAWESSNRAGLEAMSKGDFDAAETTLLKSLKDAEACGANDERVGVSLNNLASVYEEKKMYTECLGLLNRSKKIFQQDLPSRNKVLPVVLGNEARILSELNKNAEAEIAYVEAIDLQRKTKSPELPDTLKGYSHVLTELAKTDAAKAALDESNSLRGKGKS